MDKNQESFSGVIYYNTVSYNVKSAILINALSEIILKQDHPLLISNCDSKMSVLTEGTCSCLQNLNIVTVHVFHRVMYMFFLH